MAMKSNHKCIICGTEYYACNDCLSIREFNPWRKTACSIECFQTYLALVEYEAGRMTKARFGEVLIANGFDKTMPVEALREMFEEAKASVTTPAVTPAKKSRRGIMRK